LKEQQQKILKLHKNCEEQECQKNTRHAYQELRMTWERAVEEILLSNVVLRFRKGVATQRLAEVVVDDSDYDKVNAGMSKCSNYAHDKASIGGAAVPSPEDLLQDICNLETWCEEVKKRSKTTSQKRKG
jgi:hypothetical protein